MASCSVDTARGAMIFHARLSPRCVSQRSSRKREDHEEADEEEEQGTARSSEEGRAPPRSEVVSVSRSLSANVSTKGGHVWQSELKRVYKERVLVRIYDLGQTFVTRWHNKVSRQYGAFHSGVEIYGREWSFGMTFDEVSTGVIDHKPGGNPDHTFRETLSMGYTTLSPRQVKQIIGELRVEWKGCTYHVLQRNCHNFSECLCAKLGVARLPAWVNDLAHTGAQTVEYLDHSESGYDGGKAVADFFESVKSSLYNTFAGDPNESRAPGDRPPGREQRRAAATDRPHHAGGQRQQPEAQLQYNPFSALRRR